MDRRLIAGLLGLCVAGCAHSRSAMPEVAGHDPLVVADGLPPTKDIINRIDIPRDNATKRAKLDSMTMTPSLPAMPPMSQPSPPAGTDAPASDTSVPAGRPAPFATQAPRSARAVAPTAMVKSTDDTPRPSPYSGAVPTNVRRRSTGPDQVLAAAPVLGTESPAQPPISPPRELTELPTPPSPPPVETPPPSQAKPLAALPPLMRAQLPESDAPPPVMIAARASEPTPVAPAQVDANVIQAGATSESSEKAKGERRDAQRGNVGGMAAMVGSEVITLDQLRRHLKEQLEKVPSEQKNDPEFQRMIVNGLLQKLIERTLVVQAVKKQIKEAKNLQGVYDSIDKSWTETELPPLLRANACANIYELKRKFADQGKSLEAIREDWRFDTLAREFMMSKIQTKLVASLPEKQRYYTEHLKDFNRPAQITWHEIVIDNAKSTSRAEARKKIDAILTRVKKGEDFSTIAINESHGATAREGGKWEIAPGGYAVPEINQALANLPEGGISTVIEAPGGFHIVRVDEKRTAGPARFDEVQDEIKDLVLRQKFSKYAEAFIENLRTRTIVWTMFDKPNVDPSAVRTSGEQPTPKR